MKTVKQELRNDGKLKSCFLVRLCIIKFVDISFFFLTAWYERRFSWYVLCNGISRNSMYLERLCPICCLGKSG